MERPNHRLLVLLVVLGLALVACAAPQKPSTASERPAASPAPAAPAAQPTREQKLVEGAKKEGEVVLWVTSIAERENLTKLFQTRYPFLKLRIWDADVGEMVTKTAEEAKLGRHSVDVLMMGGRGIADLQTMGLLAEYEFPNSAGWIQQPRHNYYKAPYFTGRLVAYNTDLVSPAVVPKSWDDLKSPRWAGMTFAAMAGVDVPLLWAYLWRENDKLNWEKSLAFWGDAIRNTRPKIATYTAGLERMAAGEGVLFLPVASPSTVTMMAKGAPIGIASVGTVPGIASGMALVKDAPHPNAGMLLIDWLSTPEGLLAYSDPRMVLVSDPALQWKARGNRYLSSLNISLDMVPFEVMTEENTRKSSEFWMKALGLRG